MAELTEYSLKTEDKNANRAEQDRLAALVGSLAAAIPVLGSPPDGAAMRLLETKVQKLVELCEEEDVLQARLAELRSKGEM
jgi:hypothetical protein